jgi:ABC-type proline/glycine betaine transport system permease subunit
VILLILLISKLFILLTYSEETEDKIIGGWLGDGIDWLGENFKKGLIEIVNWIITGLFNVLTPIINWGCKSIIVLCFIVYFCSYDKRAISKAIWTFFIYILFFMLRSVVIK